MRTVISWYFLIQSIIVGIFCVKIFHSFADGFDTLLLIMVLLTSVISLWSLLNKCDNELLSFVIYLTYSFFVCLFEIPLLIIGNAAPILLLLGLVQTVLNIYLSFVILQKNR